MLGGLASSIAFKEDKLTAFIDVPCEEYFPIRT